MPEVLRSRLKEGPFESVSKIEKNIQDIKTESKHEKINEYETNKKRTTNVNNDAKKEMSRGRDEDYRHHKWLKDSEHFLQKMGVSKSIIDTDDRQGRSSRSHSSSKEVLDMKYQCRSSVEDANKNGRSFRVCTKEEHGGDKDMRRISVHNPGDNADNKEIKCTSVDMNLLDEEEWLYGSRKQEGKISTPPKHENTSHSIPESSEHKSEKTWQDLMLKQAEQWQMNIDELQLPKTDKREYKKKRDYIYSPVEIKDNILAYEKSYGSSNRTHYEEKYQHVIEPLNEREAAMLSPRKIEKLTNLLSSLPTKASTMSRVSEVKPSTSSLPLSKPTSISNELLKEAIQEVMKKNNVSEQELIAAFKAQCQPELEKPSLKLDRLEAPSKQVGEKGSLEADIKSVHKHVEDIFRNDNQQEKDFNKNVQIPHKPVLLPRHFSMKTDFKQLKSDNLDYRATKCDRDSRGTKGDVDLRDNRGDVDLRGAKGDIDLRGNKGDVDLCGIKSYVNFRSASSIVDLHRRKNDFDLRDNKDDIDFRGSKCDVVLRGSKDDTDLRGGRPNVGYQDSSGSRLSEMTNNKNKTSSDKVPGMIDQDYPRIGTSKQKSDSKNTSLVTYDSSPDMNKTYLYANAKQLKLRCRRSKSSSTSLSRSNSASSCSSLVNNRKDKFGHGRNTFVKKSLGSWSSRSRSSRYDSNKRPHSVSRHRWYSSDDSSVSPHMRHSSRQSSASKRRRYSTSSSSRSRSRGRSTKSSGNKKEKKTKKHKKKKKKEKMKHKLEDKSKGKTADTTKTEKENEKDISKTEKLKKLEEMESFLIKLKERKKSDILRKST